MLVLLIVVSLATRGRLGGSEGGPGPGGGFVDYVFTVFFVVFLLMIPIAAWIYWMQRAQIVFELTQTRRKRRYADLLTLAFLIAIALWIRYLHNHNRLSLGPHLKNPGAAAPKRLGRGQGGTEPIFQWWLAALIVGVVFIGVATGIVLWQRSKRRTLLEATTAAEAVSLALDEVLDDLHEGDPREAVIRAYSRMETVLAFYGLPRESHEAPFEWLRRILVSLHASALSVERLAELFERAKFSLHTIDEGMREDAIGALTTVRDELRAAPA